MVPHFLGNVREKIMVHDDTDANEQAHVEAVAFEDFVNAAAFHVDSSGKPYYSSALGPEFPLDHGTKMNGL